MKSIKSKVILAVIFGCIQSIGTLGCAWLLTIVVQIVTGDMDIGFGKFCILAFLYYIVYVIIYFVSKNQYYHVIQRVRVQLKEKLLVGLIWNSEENHRDYTMGNVMAFFQNYVELIETAYWDPLFLLIKNIVVLVVSIGTVIVMQWQFAIGMILSLYLYITKGIQTKLTQLQNESVAAQVEENNQLVTMVQSYYTAKDYGEEAYFIEKYEKSVQESSKKACKCNIGYNFLQMISSNIETLFILLILLCGSWMLANHVGLITAGKILGITQFVAAMFEPAGSMGTLISKIKSTEGVREELEEYIHGGEEGRGEWTESTRDSLPKLERIVLRDVSFSYGETKILDHVSMTCSVGKKYAIVGASGEGKTTLLKLLLKQLSPDQGEIFWNQCPYSKIGKGRLLQKFSYVAQSPMMFRKSVGENIVGGNQAQQKMEREYIENVAKRSGVDLIRQGMTVEKIQKLQATELSCGEKKRVAYARALYKQGDVLLLDEVTSGLDKTIAEQLEKDMLQTNEQMVIHVTHQLSTEMMAYYDEVFCIQNRQVIAIKNA